MFATLLGILSDWQRFSRMFSSACAKKCVNVLHKGLGHQEKGHLEGAPQRWYAKQNLILAASVGPRLVIAGYRIKMCVCATD